MKTLLILFALGAQGADSYYTNRNINNANFAEHDPLAKPFVHNTFQNAAFSAINMGVVLYISHRLRKHAHNQFANTILAGDVAGHTYGAATSAMHRR